MSNVSAQIELNSPSNKSFKICRMRRSIQSYVEISLFPLDESGSPSAVKSCLPIVVHKLTPDLTAVS